MRFDALVNEPMYIVSRTNEAKRLDALVNRRIRFVTRTNWSNRLDALVNGLMLVVTRPGKWTHDSRHTYQLGLAFWRPGTGARLGGRFGGVAPVRYHFSDRG